LIGHVSLLWRQKKAQLFGLRLFISTNSSIANWIGEMGHGWELYFVNRINELGGIGVVWGLDKIWGERRNGTFTA
jgi:hypothetical protein